MTLKEHYKFHSRKSVKPYSRLLTLIFLMFTAVYTLSRFISSAVGNTELAIATWSIAINNEQITNSSSQLSNAMPLLNSSDGSTSLKKRR